MPAITFTTSFTRNLSIGVRGEDVKRLQIFLNNNGFLVSSSGAGSKGKETTVFGPATKKALIKFQENYRKELLTPLFLYNGTGYFGPATRKKVNEIIKKVN